MRRPRARIVALLVGVGLAVGVSASAAYAAFFATTTNPGNSFAAASDWTPPSAGASVIADANASVSGFIHQGGQYFVFADVTDTGNPPSGVSSVTADVSNLSAGQTAVPLVTGPCPCSIDGTTYSYRSAAVAADATLIPGAKLYSLTMTDGTGNQATQSGFIVVVDNSTPAGSDVQTANGGFMPGRAETNDTIVYTYTETMDPDSILAGWDGTPATVTVRLVDNLGGRDAVRVYNAANTTELNLGTVNLQRNDYTQGGGVTFANSTIVQTGAGIAVTLGIPDLPARLRTVTVAASMTWPPSNLATDPAGNACSIAQITETGILDLEF